MKNCFLFHIINNSSLCAQEKKKETQFKGQTH